jgi:hypothetical protein
MKQRILTGWTFTRVLYVGLGTAVLINAVISQQWFGVLFGGYFASMGIFAFGCASGNCVVKPKQNNTSKIQEVEFEEIT